MEFSEGQHRRVERTVLSDKLDEIISWIKTKYHSDGVKSKHLYDEFYQTRAKRNEIYRQKRLEKLEILGWKVDKKNKNAKRGRHRDPSKFNKWGIRKKRVQTV